MHLFIVACVRKATLATTASIEAKIARGCRTYIVKKMTILAQKIQGVYNLKTKLRAFAGTVKKQLGYYYLTLKIATNKC